MKKFIENEGFMAAFAVVMVVIGVWLMIEGGLKWDTFKKEHQCKVVAHIDGEIFNTFGIDGKGNMAVGVGSTSDKTGWLCDDGVTYYR